MMFIYLKIPVHLNIQIDGSMARDLIQHMIKERKSGINIGFTGTIQIDSEFDFGLVSISRYSVHTWECNQKFTDLTPVFCFQCNCSIKVDITGQAIIQTNGGLCT